MSKNWAHRYWKNLSGPLRAYYAQRIAIIGPQSTGKSTLAQELAKHYGTVWVPEYARLYAEQKQGELTVHDVDKIAAGHFDAEEALAQQCHLRLFVDTDAIMTTLYSRYYYQSCPEWVDALAASKTYDLYLLTAPDVPWIADRQRDPPDVRQDFFLSCKTLLEEKKSRFVIISGDWSERFEQAIAAVESLASLDQ